MQVQLFHVSIDNAEFWLQLQQFALIWVNLFFRLRDVTCKLHDEPFDIITHWFNLSLLLFGPVPTPEKLIHHTIWHCHNLHHHHQLHRHTIWHCHNLHCHALISFINIQSDIIIIFTTIISFITIQFDIVIIFTTIPSSAPSPHSLTSLWSS